MKVTKVLTLVFTTLFLDVLVACCDCDPPQLFKYTNSSLEVENLDNRGQYVAVATNGTALKEAYGIRMKIQCKTTAFHQPRFSFLLNQSYAFSCRCEDPIQYHAKDSVVALRIITLDNFDPEHQAGSDITDYFKWYGGYYFSEITSYIKQRAPVFYMEDDKQTTEDMLLMHYPPQSGIYSFRVEIDLSDGRTLTKDTDSIELQ